MTTAIPVQRPAQDRILNLDPVQWNPPPADFDPITADPETLDRYHLPAQPDPDRTPAAYSHWYRAMSKPLLFVQGARREVFTGCDWDQSLFFRASRDVPQESSSNWSGGVVRPNTSEAFSAVEGCWTVTQPNPPPPIQDGEYRASIWVGLDGHDPTSLGMPQIGTLEKVVVTGGVVSATEYSAWFQWWVRDSPSNIPISISGLSVNANALIYAKVVVLGPWQVRFFIKNLTTSGPAVSFDYNLPLPPAGAVEGLTAEWIVERPTIVGTDNNRYTLADYQTDMLLQCNATVGTSPGAYDQNLAGANLIRMVDWDDPVNPGKIVSSPKRLGHSGLVMQYGDLGP